MCARSDGKKETDRKWCALRSVRAAVLLCLQRSGRHRCSLQFRLVRRCPPSVAGGRWGGANSHGGDCRPPFSALIRSPPDRQCPRDESVQTDTLRARLVRLDVQ